MYLRRRVIPCLTIEGNRLVKTLNFKNPRYIGDPVNAVKIFNGKEVDELSILDISKFKDKREIDFAILASIASEAFIPLSYGGGIRNIDQIDKLFKLGFEKVVINTSFYFDEKLIELAVKKYGSQSVVVSLDVRKDFFGKYNFYSNGGSKKENITHLDVIEKIKRLNIGELIVTSIDKEGCMNGYDYKLYNLFAPKLDIPVVANGGAGNLRHIYEAFDKSNVHAVLASSMFVYYGKLKAVLISYPSEDELKKGKVYN